jgi:hypothetical protein
MTDRGVADALDACVNALRPQWDAFQPLAAAQSDGHRFGEVGFTFGRVSVRSLLRKSSAF